MKATILTFFVLLSANVSFSQLMTGEEFKKDLKFIYENLKKSASYKTQKENHWKVEQRYQQLMKGVPGEIFAMDALENFYQLTDEIKDYHNSISTNSKVFTFAEMNEKAKLDSILSRSRGYFKITKVKLDSIERNLENTDVNDHEGIYHLGKWLTVAVIKTPDKLIGIILKSQLPSWQRGEEIFYLIPKGNERFRMITGSAIDKRLISSIEGFKGGIFRSSGWKKSNAIDIIQLNKMDTAKYVYKNIVDGISFIKVTTFNTSNTAYREAMNFYTTLNPKNFEKNVILDLRHNSGGGIRNSRKLFKILKKHKGNFYILSSYYTVSHGEQFVLEMKKLPNVKVLGERTLGMLTYGTNFGTTYNTLSGKFTIMFKDLKDNWKEYLKYEGIGIEPDIPLSENTDWINQVQQIMKRQ